MYPVLILIINNNLPLTSSFCKYNIKVKEFKKFNTPPKVHQTPGRRRISELRTISSRRALIRETFSASFRRLLRCSLVRSSGVASRAAPALERSSIAKVAQLLHLLPPLHSMARLGAHSSRFSPARCLLRESDLCNSD